MAWAQSQRVDDLHLITYATPISPEAGALARRAGYFDPSPSVWCAAGQELLEAQAIPPPLEPIPPSIGLRWITVIEAAGAEAVVEYGIIRAEVLGLEVARVVVDDHSSRLEVGVGRFDRELRQMVEADADPTVALHQAAEAVRRWRRSGVSAHPANQIAPERWLRAVVSGEPDLLGQGAPRNLVSRPAPVRRADLSARAPAPALGAGPSGEMMLVVCSVGVDIDLIPAAAEARAQAGLVVDDPIHLWVVVPDGDDHRVIRDMASRLSDPAQVRTVPTDWRRHQS